jgi:hypothetical protein
MKRAGTYFNAETLRLIILVCLIIQFNKTEAQGTHFSFTKELPKKLKEISGLARDGDHLWAIIDSKNADIYKLDFSGKIIQQIHLSNFKLKDVEAVTADEKYIYVGDVGDNNGTRPDRTKQPYSHIIRFG